MLAAVGYERLNRWYNEPTPPVLKNDINGYGPDNGSLKPKKDKVVGAYRVIENLNGRVSSFS